MIFGFPSDFAVRFDVLWHLRTAELSSPTVLCLFDLYVKGRRYPTANKQIEGTEVNLNWVDGCLFSLEKLTAVDLLGLELLRERELRSTDRNLLISQHKVMEIATWQISDEGYSILLCFDSVCDYIAVYQGNTRVGLIHRYDREEIQAILATAWLKLQRELIAGG